MTLITELTDERLALGRKDYGEHYVEPQVYRDSLRVALTEKAELEEKSKTDNNVCMAAMTVANESEARIRELDQQVATLEEYMLKGVAFRDELQARIAELEEESRHLQAKVKRAQNHQDTLNLLYQKALSKINALQDDLSERTGAFLKYPHVEKLKEAESRLAASEAKNGQLAATVTTLKADLGRYMMAGNSMSKKLVAAEVELDIEKRLHSKASADHADAELTRLRKELDKSYSFDVFNNVVEANGIFRKKLMAVGYNPRELLEEAELRRKAKEG